MDKQAVMGLGRSTWPFIVALAAGSALLAGGCTDDAEWAGPQGPVDVTERPEFAEPVMLSARDGVLEVTLTARQGTAGLDTVALPVDDFLLFGYEVEQGASSDGALTSNGVYPAPTLHVDPGDTLIVHLDNELLDLTVRDYIDPAFTPVGAAVPIYPEQLTSSPFNLHTHGLHVSPSGNSDNVLLDIPAGMSNTYTYEVPVDHPQGLYWYHSHRHTITAQQTYAGLAGLLQIGRPDGAIPLVTANDLPVRNMALQYNYVADRRGGQHRLNNVNWPQYVSTLEAPTGDQLADGTYEPSLAPVNFSDTDPGTTYVTDWYSGALSIDNNRGLMQFLPSNLVAFAASDDAADDVAAEPELPDYERDVQFTVNRQFQPTVSAAPGQTEIWVLANISDFAYMNVTLTETATGKHPPLAVVAQDGNPYEKVQRPTSGDGTTLLIPPASRYAIAVTMPAEGELVLEMPQLPDGSGVSGDGIRYTSNGTPTPPAVLGTVSAPATAVSYVDGFFAFPTQKLLRMRPTTATARPTVFAPGQALDAFTSFVDTSEVEPAVTRTLRIGGGFLNTLADPNDPKSFVYAFDDNAFPSTALIQPRLNSVEEWTIVNENNDEHPIHIHVNDFQVTDLSDPVAGTDSGPQPWGQDNANTPAPLYDASGNVSEPGVLTLRTRFQDYTGTYVIHCHRLNHEDNGLMAIVNVIPEVSSYAVATADGRITVHDGADDSVMAEVTPFVGDTTAPSVAMADVDGDQVLDLIAGAGPGSSPTVVIYSGASTGDAGPFGTELRRFSAFRDDMTAGLSVAGADIDGDSVADIVVGAGPGSDSHVKVFGSASASGEGRAAGAPEVFSEFAPYGDSRSGVTVATGMVDDMSGRSSVVTAPGPGVPAEIRTWRFDLYSVTAAGRSAGVAEENDHASHLADLGIDIGGGADSSQVPMLTSSFLAFDGTYTGGTSLAVGWLAGTEGGAQRVIVGQLGDEGQVRVFATSSALEAGPGMYLQSPQGHDAQLSFTRIGPFTPFDAPGGVRVATTSTVDGADLIVGSSLGQGSSRYQFARSSQDPTMLEATRMGNVSGAGGTAVGSLGGA